jgi:single-stranded DNA-binding protein
VFIEGAQNSREWMNADGQTLRAVEVLAQHIEFLDEVRKVA